jgi:DNA-binding NarL/FixJ family response regulator
MRLAVDISVLVDGKRHSLGSIPIDFHLRDLQPLKPLSRRHEEVLDLVATGKCNKDIATQLSISESTVKFHISLLMRRFGVGSRVELIAARHRHIYSGGQHT